MPHVCRHDRLTNYISWVFFKSTTPFAIAQQYYRTLK